MRALTYFFFSFLFLGISSCNKCCDGDVVSTRYIHKYGFHVSEKEWQERDMDGKIEKILNNGIIVTENYENGLLHGPTTITYPYSNTVEKLYIFGQGDLIREIAHDRKAQPVIEHLYEYDNRKIITRWDVYGVPISVEEYDNDLLIQGTYYDPSNEIEAKVQDTHGTRIKRDRYGQLLAKDEITNGKLTRRVTYHPNKEVYMDSSFEDYLPNGEQSIYTDSGKLYMRSNWDQGQLNGLKVGYRNGKKIFEIPYIEGKKEGLEKRFDENEHLMSEIEFKSDERHGKSIYFNGDNAWSEWFYRDKPVSPQKFQMLENRDQFLADLND